MKGVVIHHCYRYPIKSAKTTELRYRDGPFEVPECAPAFAGKALRDAKRKALWLFWNFRSAGSFLRSKHAEADLVNFKWAALEPTDYKGSQALGFFKLKVEKIK